MLSIGVSSFSSWRDAARLCLDKNVAPAEVQWRQAPVDEAPTPPVRGRSAAEPDRYFRVPKPFVELARLVSCHRDPVKWELLYRTLWRITRGERSLLDFRIDHDVYRLQQMAEAVRLDAQRFKALLRFQRLEGEGDRYVAWFCPEHLTLRLAAPYFAERFRMLQWKIFTPDESVSWNGKQLEWGPGAPSVRAPGLAELAELWHADCRKSPAVSPDAAAANSRLSSWAMLGESRGVDDAVRIPREPSSMNALPDRSRRSAADFLPERSGLKALQRAAQRCEGCDLHRQATQTVFGEGPVTAQVMLIGEQPGDEEDIIGRPFVGPAGQLLNELLAEVGLDRNEVYVTNAVKHFKHTTQGKRRLHAKPTRGEVMACRPWLEHEIQTLEPTILVCLGATAAQSLLGTQFRITQQRGEFFASDWAPLTLATWHPSSLLRIPDPADRDKRRQELTADLRLVVAQLAASQSR